jgi:hypothetical protein
LTVLSLPPQLVFPGSSVRYFVSLSGCQEKRDRKYRPHRDRPQAQARIGKVTPHRRPGKQYRPLSCTKKEVL